MFISLLRYYPNKAKLARLGLLIVFILLTIFLAVIPLINNITSIKLADTLRQASLNQQYLQAKNLKKYSAASSQDNISSSTVEKEFISSEASTELFRKFDQLSEQNNLESSTNLEQSTSGSNQAVLLLEINLSGQRTDLLNYLKDLELINYYINPYMIELRQNKAGNDDYLMKILAKSYWQK